MVSQVKTSAPLRNEPWFDSAGIPTLRAAEYLEGNEGEIVEILDRLDVIDVEITAIKARLDVLEALTFIQVTATANHTTTRNEIITCTNTSLITITLNATPNTIPGSNEEARIIRAGSTVKVNGNGKKIMGLYGSTGVDEITLNGIGQSMNLVYNSTTDMWHM